LHSQSCRYFEKGRGKGAYATREGLGFQFFDFFFGESVALSGKAAKGADFLRSDDIILLHETVSLREDGEDILIKLHT